MHIFCKTVKYIHMCFSSQFMPSSLRENNSVLQVSKYTFHRQALSNEFVTLSLLMRQLYLRAVCQTQLSTY